VPKLRNLKFGDIVVNHWASVDNPTREGVFIRYVSRYAKCTDMKDKFWDNINDEDGKLEKVGSIFDKEPK